MEIARDISEYSASECRAIYRSNGGKLVLINHWIREGTNHSHADRVEIDGRSFEVYIKHAPNRSGYVREDRKSFKDTGFDVVADLHRLWIIFPDFITIVCESSILGGNRSREDQIDFANICKFIRGANLNSNLIPEKDSRLGLDKFSVPEEIEEYDANDVKRILFNRDGTEREISFNAVKVLKYSNDCKEIEIDGSGEVRIWFEIWAPPAARKEPEVCRIQVGYGDWKRDFYPSKVWFDYSDDTRILIASSERKSEGIMIDLDPLEVGRTQEIKEFLYSCIHYDLYRDNVIKKNSSRRSDYFSATQAPELGRITETNLGTSMKNADEKQKRVVEILKKYNQHWTDSRRLKALLSDCIPEDRLVIHVMQIAYEENICVELQSGGNVNIITGKFVKIMSSNYGISAENARWAVDTWVRVFDLEPAEQPSITNQSGSNHSDSMQKNWGDIWSALRGNNESSNNNKAAQTFDPLGIMGGGFGTQEVVSEPVKAERRKEKIVEENTFKDVHTFLKDQDGYSTLGIKGINKYSSYEVVNKCGVETGEIGDIPQAIVDAKAFAELKEFTFRNFDHRLLYYSFDTDTLRVAFSQFQHEEGDNALLVYGYIDQETGITFEVLCAVLVKDGQPSEFRKGNPNISFKIRYAGVSGKLVNIEDDSPALMYYAATIKKINDTYKCPEAAIGLRQIASLDSSRYPGFPDDIVVWFLEEGKDPEGIWVRIDGHDGKHITGKLLDEPWRDYGYHKGDSVPFDHMEMNREMKAVAVLKK